MNQHLEFAAWVGIDWADQLEKSYGLGAGLGGVADAVAPVSFRCASKNFTA
jgi:hypothetical protein